MCFKHLRFILLFLSFSRVYAQDSRLIKHSFLETGALVSYYFWEEDSLGFIRNQVVLKPFLQNYYIGHFLDEKKHITQPDVSELISIVRQFAHEPGEIEEKQHFELKDSVSKQKISFALYRKEAVGEGTMLYARRNGAWISMHRKKVVYFTIDSENRMRYSHASDSVVLSKHKVKTLANGPFVVFTYYKENRQIEKQLIYTYSGEAVTDFFKTHSTMQPGRVLVFVNGYRGPKVEKDVSDHMVTSKDRYYYWFKVDNRFIEILKPSKSYYLDGSMSIHTSNHRTMFGFLKSFIRSSFVFRKKNARANYKRLNSNSNVEGFKERKEKGRTGGKALFAALCNSPACEQTKDTVDIVCHSMGYAYSLGMIEELKGKVVFGKIYILAPENACVEGSDWTIFEQVWQYGSNLDQKNPDPLWQQDGVAPQCAVKGLDSLDISCGGRAFIPKDWPRKNFVDSHMLYNFEWIFDRIKEGEAGYITK